MAKNTPRKKDLTELLMVAFVLVCSALIMFDVSNNLLYEINYADQMKHLEVEQ